MSEVLLFNPVELLEVALEDDETEEVDTDLGMSETPSEILLGLGVEDLPLDLSVRVGHVLPGMLEPNRSDVAAEPLDVVHLVLAGPLVLHPRHLVSHSQPFPEEELKANVHRDEWDLYGGCVEPGLLLVGVLQHLLAEDVGREHFGGAGQVALAQTASDFIELVTEE